MFVARASRSEMEDRREKCLPNPQWNIKELPANVTNEIQRMLDMAPQERNWKALIGVMAEKFHFGLSDIGQFGMAVHQDNGSPTGKLLVRLSSRDFKVKDLIHYLDMLGWESLLLKLKPYEPIKVLRSPQTKLLLMEGETLTLTVEAVGFPYPRYQWFKGDKEVDCATDNVLVINNIRISEEGSYCCRLHNCADLDKLVFTEKTGVTVRENHHRSEPPQQNDDRPMLYERDQSIPTVEGDKIGHERTKTSQQRRGMCDAPQILHQSKDITVTSGETFCLQCPAIGLPELHYQWLKNGSVIQTGSSQFRVEKAEVIDTGSYECRINNDYGIAKSDIIFVLVKGGSTQIVPSSYPRHAATLDIVVQPKSCKIEKGGSAIFTCEVVSQGPVTYQWYKDGKPLPGENKAELIRKNIRSFQEEGCFQCHVSNNNYNMLTSGAFLQLAEEMKELMPAPTDGTIYTATDKIALLIGNYDYIGTDSLKAPKTDVQVLAELYRSMDFKVVSLLNLTLGEMEAAVNEFCILLAGDRPEGSGVYGVFYFCGHGIEEKGQCYLVPQDAPTGFSSRNCLCAQFVLARMQEQKPAICCMILDCCRISNSDSDSLMETGKQMTTYQPRPTGNAVYFYATTQGMRAYEYEMDHTNTGRLPEPNGILVKYLQRHLCKKKSIEAVFADVRENVNQDPKLKNCQIPEVKTNLVEPLRSFSDKIQYTGHTEAFSKRYMRWQGAHAKPRKQDICVKHLGIVVGIEYQADFSNVLSIFLTVKDPGVTKGCIAWVINLPPTLSVMTVKQIAHSPQVKTKTVIQDMQKLKERLVLTVSLQYSLDGKQCSFNNETVDLGLPLVSTLRLWERDRNVNGQPIFERQPMEHYYQGDDPSYMNLKGADPYYVNVPQPCMSRGGPPYVNVPQSGAAPPTEPPSYQNGPPAGAYRPPLTASEPAPPAKPTRYQNGPPAGACGPPPPAHEPPPAACGSMAIHVSHIAKVSPERDVAQTVNVTQAQNVPQSASLPQSRDVPQLEAMMQANHISLPPA